MANNMQDIDTLAFRLYERIITAGPVDFGTHALAISAETLGASSAAWIIWHHDSRRPGILATHNIASSGLEELDVAGCLALRHALFGKNHEGMRVAAHDLKKNAVRELAGLVPPGTRYCLAACVPHRGGRLDSLLLFCSDAKQPAFDSHSINTARELLPHLADAATLAQRALISRDQLLQRMGRPSRGTPGLVDADGGIYEADDGFMRLLGETFNGWDRRRVPLELPIDADAASREIKFGTLRARTEPQGRLFLVHVRRLKPLDILSRRERDVARGIVSGLTLKTIGQRLGISASTVANHAARIYEKLGIHNRDQLVDIATNASTPAKQTTG